MLLKTLIVDDEEFARSSLYFLLREYCKNINIVGICQSVAEAQEILAQQPVDLVFLDIAMPGQNGFELIPHINHNSTKIIFTTAYSNYALKAIKANALDYLMKPIAIDELIEAVEKAEKAKTTANLNNGMPPQIIGLSAKTEINKITLPTGQGYRIVETADIICIEADSNYSIFHLANNENVAVSKVLRDYEEILPEKSFFRVHKSNIINLAFVKEYQSRNGFSVLLKNGKQIAVSRRRASDFHDKLKAFTQRD